MIIAQALLPRTGLGNKLFPWSRCVVFSRTNNIAMIKPKWFNLKFGHLLRSERDARLYLRQFRSSKHDLNSATSAIIELLANKLPEPKDLDSTISHSHNNRFACYRFQGLGDHFYRLLPHAKTIRDELLSIAQTRIVETVRGQLSTLPAIAIHVRRGDFAQADSDEDLITKGNIQTPLKWFINTFKVIRSMDSAAQAYVVSDADNSEIEQLLEIPGIQRRTTGSALGDLLLLSNAKLIIGSGGSSYSAWGAFLGQCPIITVEGQCMSWFNLPKFNDADHMLNSSCFAVTLGVKDVCSQSSDTAGILSGLIPSRRA